MKRILLSLGLGILLEWVFSAIPETPATDPTAPSEFNEPVVPEGITVADAAKAQPDLQHHQPAGETSIALFQPHFIGHRYFKAKSGAWGWVKRPEETWEQARWVAIKETPRQYTVPDRGMENPEADHDFEYRLLGRFAGYGVYDPHWDEVVDVFVIEGYESLGETAPLEMKPGAAEQGSRDPVYSKGAQSFSQQEDD